MFAGLLRRITISDWESAYLQYAEKFAQNTRRAKAFAFGALRDEFGASENVRRITAQRILVWLSRIANKRSGGSANQMRKHLAAAWAWGVKYFAMPERNPFCVPRFPEDERPRYVPPLENFNAVLALTSGPDHAMLLTALHTAARRGEIFRLTWDDVDFGRGMLRLGTRKRSGGGMQYDWVPLTAALAQTLAAHQDTASGVALVFPRRNGEQYMARPHFLRRLCDKAGVKRFGYHGIRHLSASMMDAGRLPITSIQAVLRHTSPLTTARYLHKLGGIRDSLDQVFSEVPP